MKQAAFEQAHAAEWAALEEMLAALESHRQGIDPGSLSRFGEHYRRLVRQHALAVDRRYSLRLIDRLQSLLQRSHHQFYQRRNGIIRRLVRFIAIGFPVAVRRHARFFWLATALFYLPALAMGIWSYLQPEAIYSVLGPPEVANLEYMYDPDNVLVGRNAERQSSTSFEMLGFYIWNNTGIGFRSFGGGLLFGIGTLLVTLFNGVVIGAAAGHLSGLGYHEVFWPFVSGHSAFELTAICISGAAGLMLGAALLMPGRARRATALRRAAAESVPLISGAALFFFAAAFVEAFWSPMDLPAGTKYVVSAALWAWVALYLGLFGRGRRAT